jgi:uncharacterized protein YcbX
MPGSHPHQINHPQIHQLWVYPVKSLRGIELQHSAISQQGLAHDRQWMLVMPNGRFVTQRQVPHMALINTAISGQNLILSQAGKGSVEIPMEQTSGEIFDGTVWRDSVEVQEASEAASHWLTETLKAPQPLKLVRMKPDYQRQHCNPERFGREHHTHFADAAPFLIANQASLDALNQHLESKGRDPVDIRRFRPNIVIEGLPAFSEHNLTEIELGGVKFKLVDHCERCTITTINPDTAAKDPNQETYKYLAEINAMPDNPKAPAFGVNATLISPETNTIQISA